MSYSLILIPIIVVIITQIIKLSIDKIKGNLNLRNIFISYGGMPSAHTALAMSVVTMTGIYEGIKSSLFAVALIFSLIIMRDAITFRNVLGKQSKLLNELINRLPNIDKNKMPRFQERLGHSTLEVAIGAVWGVVMTWILYFIFSLL